MDSTLISVVRIQLFLHVTPSHPTNSGARGVLPLQYFLQIVTHICTDSDSENFGFDTNPNHFIFHSMPMGIWTWTKLALKMSLFISATQKMMDSTLISIIHFQLILHDTPSTLTVVLGGVLPVGEIVGRLYPFETVPVCVQNVCEIVGHICPSSDPENYLTLISIIFAILCFSLCHPQYRWRGGRWTWHQMCRYSFQWPERLWIQHEYRLFSI